MTIDLDEILTEISWRLPNGIINLENQEHLDALRIVLREKNFDDSFIDSSISRLKKKKVEEKE